MKGNSRISEEENKLLTVMKAVCCRGCSLKTRLTRKNPSAIIAQMATTKRSSIDYRLQ